VAENAGRRIDDMTTATAPGSARDQASSHAAARPQRRHGLDFSHPLAFAALAILFVVSRAPFLGIGYGTDPDAWRVALTGYWLWEHHEYFPSRLPGYPPPELASALVQGRPDRVQRPDDAGVASRGLASRASWRSSTCRIAD
jgi:hypothetical protein